MLNNFFLAVAVALIIDLMETETAVQHEGRKGECRS